jgi:hypothetical protein
MLVEPRAGSIHLFGLSFVDFGSVYPHLAFAFSYDVLLVRQRPKVIRAFLPLFIRALALKTKGATQIIQCLLKFVSLRAKHQSVENVGNNDVKLRIIVALANPFLDPFGSSLTDYFQFGWRLNRSER